MRIKQIGVAMVALVLAAFVARAEQKIVIVDLKVVFDGYYKTKDSDTLIKGRQKDYDTERNKMMEDYKKATDEMTKLRDAVADPAIAAEEKDKRKKAAEGKLVEIKEIEQSVRQFETQFRSQITDQIGRMREKILGEIREVINKKAKAIGANVVLDSAAQSANQTPVVIFTADVPDLTKDVLVELNATKKAGEGEGDAAAGSADDKKK